MRKRFAIDFNYSGEGECDIEDAYPSFRLVFDVMGGGTLIGVYAHEHPTGLGELLDVLWIMRNESLDRFVMAYVPQIAEDWHESL